MLSLSPVFASLDDGQREQLIGMFEVKYYMPNEIILHEGQPTTENAVYLIKKGEAAVFTKVKGDFKHPMVVLKPGEIFGEFSAITGKPPTATVMAKTALETLALSRSRLVGIIGDNPLVGQALEVTGSERILDTFLYMNYFEILEDIKDEEDWDLDLPDIN